VALQSACPVVLQVRNISTGYGTFLLVMGTCKCSEINKSSLLLKEKRQPYWNLDVSIRKNLKIFESADFEFSGIFTNIFNHNNFADPTLDISNPSAWAAASAQGNAPRKIQVGVRANF
jgi:hypothetical protein